VNKVVAHFTYIVTDQYSSITASFSNQSEGANEYHWDFGDEYFSSEFEPAHTYNPIGETVIVKLTAINNRGPHCEASYTAAIPVHEPIFIPNIITPNGDAYNQYFEVKGIEMAVWRLIVFNTWGNRVYSSQAYENDWYAENISPGIYYYELQNPNDNASFKGWLHILR
jgi:gliding motility-associated-like protein